MTRRLDRHNFQMMRDRPEELRKMRQQEIRTKEIYNLLDEIQNADSEGKQTEVSEELDSD